MYATNFFEDIILNVLNGQSRNAPSKVYLALFTGSPGDDGSGGVEASYSGYSRQEIEFTEPAEEETGLSMQNRYQIEFPEARVSVGQVTHVGVMDERLSGAGNMLLYGELNDSLNIQTGVTPIFRPGGVKWIFSGNMGNYWRRNVMNFLRGSNLIGFQPYIGLRNNDVEFAGYAYSRMQLTVCNPPEQQNNGTDLVYNVNEILSNEATGNWGYMNNVAIYDAPTNGNIYAVIPLTETYNIVSQNAVGFHVGSLRFNIN